MLDVSSDQGTFARGIRLLIADRQPIVLQGLKSVFAAQRDFEIVASCSTGTSCLEAIRKLTPDVALLADTLLDLTASEILATVQAERLATRLVFFTESETDDDLAAAVAAGACSAISKYAPPDAMLRSLRLMMEDISASPERSQDRSLNGKAIDAAKIDKMLGLLTQRESQIVRLVSEGLSNKEIARQLNLSQGTVKVHLHNIFQKLEISNRTVLATIALLQRPAGFGTLTLAAFAFAILDDVKASETNTFVDDDGTVYRDSEHPAFEVWKKAILRHTVVVDSGETAALTPRGSAVKVSQATNPAPRIEGLHAAEHAALSTTARTFGPIGPGALGLVVSPLLQAINDSRTGGPTVLQPLPPLEAVSNPARGYGGHAAFATMAAGALIHTLDHAAAAVQAPDAIDTLSDPSSSGNDTITGNGGHDTIHQGGSETGSGDETIVGEHGADQLTGSNGEDAFVYRSAKDSNATRFDTIISGTNQINLAALGALAFLQLTSTSTSVPPHTLAWIYNPTTNETIVYVNPTDRSLDIGDSALLEIHLQGVVNVAESDVVHAPDAAAVAAALESIDPALLDAAAGDGIVLTAETACASIEAEASEDARATASVWTTSAEDGFKFQFARDRISSSLSTSGLASSPEGPAYAAEESSSAGVVVPAHVSSIELAPGPASAPTEENPAFKNETALANTSAAANGHGTAHATAGPQSFEFSTQSAVIVTPAPLAEPSAPGNSGVHSNSQHAANVAEAPEPIEASTAPGNSGGHGNSQHAKTSAPANTTEAPEPVETSTAPGNSGGHGNSQHANKSAPANTGEAPEPVETGTAPGNSGGHGNSQHAHKSAPANAKEAAEPVETGTAPGNSGGHGNSQHASNKAKANAAEAPEPVEASAAPGNGAGHSAAAKASAPAQSAEPASAAGGANAEAAFHFNHEAMPSTPAATVGLEEPNGSLVLPGPGAEIAAILEVGPPAVEPHAVGHGNNGHGPPHAAGHPHDLLT
jgi:RNA polymerase sigma factor (sigma-70 family)